MRHGISSIPYLTTEWLLGEVYDPLIENSIEALKKDRIGEFMLWYDISLGFEYPVASLNVAASVKNGGADILAADMISMADDLKLPISSSDKVASYLRITDLASSLAEKLRADKTNTGYPLIRDMTFSIKTDPFALIKGSRVFSPYLLSAGADYALKAYRFVYPIAHGVLESTSSN